MTDPDAADLVAPTDADSAAAPPPADVLAGGDAAHAEDQQSNQEFPSPLGGAPWQDPDRPDEKDDSGDR